MGCTVYIGNSLDRHLQHVSSIRRLLQLFARLFYGGGILLNIVPACAYTLFLQLQTQSPIRYCAASPASSCHPPSRLRLGSNQCFGMRSRFKSPPLPPSPVFQPSRAAILNMRSGYHHHHHNHHINVIIHVSIVTIIIS